VTDEFLPTLLYGNVSDVDLNIVFTGRSGLGLRIPEETLTTSPAFPNDRPGLPRLFRFFLIILIILIVFIIFIIFIVFKLLIIISAYLELPLILGKETPRDKDPSSLF